MKNIRTSLTPLKTHRLLPLVLLGLTAIAGCGPNSDGLRIRAGINATQRQVRVADVRAAASGLFDEHMHPNQTIPTDQIPMAIASLPVFLGAPRTDIDGSVCDQGELFFMTGSGFGHWGILICRDKTVDMPKQFPKGKLTWWGDGVFFFSEIRWK